MIKTGREAGLSLAVAAADEHRTLGDDDHVKWLGRPNSPLQQRSGAMHAWLFILPHNGSPIVRPAPCGRATHAVSARTASRVL